MEEEADLGVEEVGIVVDEEDSREVVAEVSNTLKLSRFETRDLESQT